MPLKGADTMGQVMKPKDLEQTFVPSRVEGVNDVEQVIVHPDRLEVNSADRDWFHPNAARLFAF